MNALYHSSVCAIYAFPFLRVTFSECLLSLCQTQETNLDGHHENHSQLTGVCQNFLYNKIDPLGMPHTIRLATRALAHQRIASNQAQPGEPFCHLWKSRGGGSSAIQLLWRDMFSQCFQYWSELMVHVKQRVDPFSFPPFCTTCQLNKHT